MLNKRLIISVSFLAILLLIAATVLYLVSYFTETEKDINGKDVLTSKGEQMYKSAQIMGVIGSVLGGILMISFVTFPSKFI